MLGNDDELNGCGKTVGHFDDPVKAVATIAMVIATFNSMLWGTVAFPRVYVVIQTKMHKTPALRSIVTLMLLLYFILFCPLFCFVLFCFVCLSRSVPCFRLV